jgi:Porin subfamily
MTFTKSILLSSVAGISAIGSAQAADLPTRKAAPAEYVRICNVGGMAGFVVPGSDTCLKISGYMNAQITGGNLKTQYTWANQGVALTSKGTKLNPTIGFDNRFMLSFDARQNTAYGILRGYGEVNVDTSNGFDNIGSAAYINVAYIQWAGFTAGKANSFFSFIGGGEGWANIFSPDQQGHNQPILFAYTATFGGGYSATLAAQSPGAVGNGPGTNSNINTSNLGMTAPDIVANVRVDQSWGAAQLSGSLHQVHVYANGAFPPAAPSQDVWGYGVNAGAKFNLPTFGPGDNVQFQATYSKNAAWNGGIPDAFWGENGAPNGNGLAMSVGDTYFAGLNAAGKPVWATPTVWSVGTTFEHYFTANYSLDPEFSYAQMHWSNSQGQLSNDSESWIVGAVAHWTPIPSILDFQLECLYENTHQSTPGAWGNTGTIDGVKAAFKNNASGIETRFQVTRNF